MRKVIINHKPIEEGKDSIKQFPCSSKESVMHFYKEYIERSDCVLLFAPSSQDVDLDTEIRIYKEPYIIEHLLNTIGNIYFQEDDDDDGEFEIQELNIFIFEYETYREAYKIATEMKEHEDGMQQYMKEQINKLL